MLPDPLMIGLRGGKSHILIPPFAYPHWPQNVDKITPFFLPFPKNYSQNCYKKIYETAPNLNTRDMVYLYNSLQVHIIFKQLHFMVKVFLQLTYFDNGLKLLGLIFKNSASCN